MTRSPYTLFEAFPIAAAIAVAADASRASAGRRLGGEFYCEGWRTSGESLRAARLCVGVRVHY